jgi:hypothetical protein
VAPLFASDEDIRASSPTKLRSSRVKEREAFFDEKSTTTMSLAATDKKKYKGRKSADLQKAIDNVCMNLY